MSKCLKAVFFVTFLALTMGVSVPLALCQEQVKSSAVQIVSGAVASVDLEKSMIVVMPEKKADGVEQKDVEVLVSDLTTIEKNYDLVLLGDLLVGDKVTVSYLIDQSGKNVAKSIAVESKEKK